MKLNKKRRLQGKTDYKTRLEFLKSGKPRIVVRVTNKYVSVQCIESSSAQDKVTSSFNSKELLKNGWPEKFKGSLKSIPACYLTGYYFGKEFLGKNKGSNDFIFDIGLARNIHGSRLYATLKGIVDAGLKLNYDEKVFPSEERIMGAHLNEELKKVIQNMKAKGSK